MGILNKLMFWKHDDELDFDDYAEKEIGPQHDDDITLSEDSIEQDKTLGLEEKSPFQEEEAVNPFSPQPKSVQAASYKSVQQPIAERDIELISSKLDTIKAILNSLDQRIAHLERNSSTEKKEKLW